MAAIQLTNKITNGSFIANINGFSGFQTNNQNAQSVLNPTQVTPLAPVHGEYATGALQIGGKTQGLIYVNPTTNLGAIVGHKYYIRSQVRLRGATAGTVSACTVVNAVNPANGTNAIPARGTTALTPFVNGLQSLVTTSWQLIDAIWTADTVNWNPRWVWQQTANSGNSDLYGQLDNVVVIDLTADFGAGNEPPLLAIRNAVLDYTPTSGWWEGTTPAGGDIKIADPPIITTASITSSLKGRSYSQQLAWSGGTAPFIFSLNGLPTGHGLSVNSAGLISGTIGLNEGSYNFTVSLEDSLGYTTTRQFTLIVAEPPVITDTYIPGAIENIPYSWSPTVTGSAAGMQVTVSVTSGTLPTGLSISGTTITGTPTIDGQTCQITVTATNNYGTDTKNFSFGVFSKPNINTISLPNGALTVAYNATLSASGQTPITWSVLTGSLPNGISLNTNTGQLTGTPTTLGVSNFSIQAENSIGTDVRTYTITTYQLPAITTTSFGYARLGSNYSVQLNATGTTPITYAITSGQLPGGLSLDGQTGIISGTPNTTGLFNFTVVATNIAGSSAPRNLSIDAGLALAIVTQSPLPIGTVGTSYNGKLTFQAEGLDSTAGISWSWTGQPTGLLITAGTGVVTGTPSVAGTYNVTVTITNGTTQASGQFSITIGASPTITSANLFGGREARPFTVVLTANGNTPIMWAITTPPSNPTAAAQISLSSNGALTWVYPIEGTYIFSVTATNEFGSSAPQQITLEISTPSIIELDIAFAIKGIPYSQQMTATGVTPHEWSIVSGSLPPGITLDPETGLISGTTSVIGSFPIRLRVENIADYFEEDFILNVYEEPKILTLSLNTGTISTAYSQTLQASGSSQERTWSVLYGSLPNGLSLNPNTGLISGTPTTLGLSTFTIGVTNITELDDTRQFTILINNTGAPIIIISSYLNNGIKGSSVNIGLVADGNPTITWTLKSGDVLPDGLSLSSAGQLTGIPTTPGIFNFSIIASNAIGSDERQFVMTIKDPPIITTASLMNAIVGEFYEATVEASGDLPISWRIHNGSLPNGLTLDPDTGVISGIVLNSGSFNFDVMVLSLYGVDVKNFSIIVTASGGCFLDGKEIGHMFLNGKEVQVAFLNGKKIFELETNTVTVDLIEDFYTVSPNNQILTPSFPLTIQLGQNLEIKWSYNITVYLLVIYSKQMNLLDYDIEYPGVNTAIIKNIQEDIFIYTFYEE